MSKNRSTVQCQMTVTACPSNTDYSRYYLQQENAELQKRLHAIKAVVDDNIDNDVAGEARSQAGDASAARRKAERAELHRQNAEMQRRLSSVRAITDDDVTDEATGGA